MQVCKFYCLLNVYILRCQLTCLLCSMYVHNIYYLAGYCSYGNTRWFLVTETESPRSFK